MLPISLQLRNFLSYGDDAATLDFRGLSLACLTGDNGVGKSSLLEAITWVTWGCARVGSDDDLLRVGSTEMEVTFVFCVQDQTYRVIRKRSRKKGKTGASTLEFQVKDGEEYRTITEPSIRATQTKIISVVGMSYETFVNSAFLRQGHADEFTVKRPNERKAILSEILGLHFYDALVERAHEKARIAELAMQSLSLVLDRMKESGVDVDALRESATAIEQKRDEAKRLFDIHEKSVSQLRDSLTQAKVDSARLIELRRHVDTTGEEIEVVKKKRDVLEKEYVLLSTVAKDRVQIEKDFSDFTEAEARFKRLQEKNVKRGTVLHERDEANHVLNELLEAVNNEIKSIEGQKTVLKSTSKKASDAKLELRTVEEKLAAHMHYQKSFDETNERISKLQNELSLTESRKSQIEKEAKELKDKRSSLDSAKAACPLCKQKLTAAHSAQVIAELEETIDRLRIEYTDNRARAKELTAAITELQSSQVELRKMSVEFESLKERQGALKNIIDEQEVSRGKLAVLADQLESLQQQLTFDKEILAAREKKETLDSEIALLHVDSNEYAQCRDLAARLQPSVERKHSLDIAESELKQLGKQRAELASRVTELEQVVAATEKDEAMLRSTVARSAALEQDMKQQLEEQVSLRASLDDYQKQLDRVSHQIEQATHEEERERTDRKKLELLTEEKALYDQLAESFGKRGIQAMIIDAAIPEIEQEANVILGRMTANQMHIVFELQKDKKTGEGVIETLDIKISDEVGTRNYELFSGGEAFRINFAIRVALSRLLARRAGAKLRMLIIDEGFGTQDEIGRDHLVAAIRAIRPEFDKIIVITHIPELKDAFAERILIVKTAKGSEIQMVS